MKFPLSLEYQQNQKPFAELSARVKQEQLERLQKRLQSNPYPTIEESALGAFMEMYEPHLIPIVIALLEKGHLIEPTSGFGKERPECQMLFGQFLLEEKMINSLGKIGVMVHKATNKRHLKFYPEKAELEVILRIYQQIVEVLPRYTGDIEISQTPQAKKFRRTYTPQDVDLRHTRLFEILMFEVQEQVSREVVTRLQENPKPTQTELNLGAFIEMIEPQVRDAVLEFNKKGYSTDISGFRGRSDMQWIDGDFTVSDVVKSNIEKENVTVVTNQSGYTSIQFQLEKANVDDIRKKWKRIAALLPDKRIISLPSMTAKAREFRKKYSRN